MEEQLANLQEIGLPEPVSYFPQTISWYIVLALVLLASLWMVWRWIRRWNSNHYRREALRELDVIEQAGQPLSRLPVLVKRAALAFAPREEVAALSGDAWLHFLGSTCPGSDFMSEKGRLLLDLSYASPDKLDQLSPDQKRELFSLVRLWIRRHRAGL